MFGSELWPTFLPKNSMSLCCIVPVTFLLAFTMPHPWHCTPTPPHPTPPHPRLSAPELLQQQQQLSSPLHIQHLLHSQSLEKPQTEEKLVINKNSISEPMSLRHVLVTSCQHLSSCFEESFTNSLCCRNCCN